MNFNSEYVQVLLVEYQAAQDSGQHHDALLWNITSIIWGASLILLGFITGSISNPNLQPLLIVLSILGVLLTVYVWVTMSTLNSYNNQKYARCQDIEELLSEGIENEKLKISQHTNLKYPKGISRIFYTVVSFLFLIAWSVTAYLAIIIEPLLTP